MPLSQCWPTKPCHIVQCSFQIDAQLLKIISHSFQLQKSWNFFHHIHMNVYYFIMIFAEFLVGWILNGFRFLDMYAHFVPFANSFVKLWWCIQCPWNFLWLIYTHSCLFWCRVLEFIICGCWDMNFWSRVWQFVSHQWYEISWFLLTCFLASN